MKKLAEIRCRVATPEDDPRFVFEHGELTLYVIQRHVPQGDALAPNPEYADAPYEITYREIATRQTK